MIHRYRSKEFKARQRKIELVRKPKRYVTVVTDPPPDPRDRVDDEYDDGDEDE